MLLDDTSGCQSKANKETATSNSIQLIAKHCKQQMAPKHIH